VTPASYCLRSVISCLGTRAFSSGSASRESLKLVERLGKRPRACTHGRGCRAAPLHRRVRFFVGVRRSRTPGAASRDRLRPEAADSSRSGRKTSRPPPWRPWRPSRPSVRRRRARPTTSKPTAEETHTGSTLHSSWLITDAMGFSSGAGAAPAPALFFGSTGQIDLPADFLLCASSSCWQLLTGAGSLGLSAAAPLRAPRLNGRATGVGSAGLTERRRRRLLKSDGSRRTQHGCADQTSAKRPRFLTVALGRGSARRAQ
jgi:hypothetical protein